MNEFGERLKYLRQEIGLTQAKLAKLIGFSKSALYYWEKGVKIPSSYAIIKLAKCFDVTADYLLGIN